MLSLGFPLLGFCFLGFALAQELEINFLNPETPRRDQHGCQKMTTPLLDEFDDHTGNMHEQLELLSPTLKEMVWKVIEIEYHVKELKEQLQKYREEKSLPAKPAPLPNNSETIPEIRQGTCSYNLSEIVAQFLRENKINEIIFINGNTSINTHTHNSTVDNESINTHNNTVDNESQTANYPLIHKCLEANETGLYTLQLPNKTNKTVGCVCDYPSVPQSPYQSGCWLLAQRRVPEQQIDFSTKLWSDYKNGFGNLMGDYWIGLDVMNQLTSTIAREVHFILFVNSTEVTTVASKTISSFQIGDESSEYRITELGSRYTTDFFEDFTVGTPFSTSDRDNANWVDGNVALHSGGGFWYITPPQANINGHFKAPGMKSRMYIRY